MNTINAVLCKSIYKSILLFIANILFTFSGSYKVLELEVLSFKFQKFIIIGNLTFKQVKC